MSWNGTPPGWDNNCEDKEWTPEGPFYFEVDYPFVEYSDDDTDAAIGRYRHKTKPEVIHAESHAITKLARGAESSEGAIMFCTHSPCVDCAKLISQAGIQTLYYKEPFKNLDGLNLLITIGVTVEILT